jgi:hypothetical protein
MKKRTVQQTVDQLATGKIPLFEAVDDFQFRTWTPPTPLSKEILAGAHDAPPPDENSIDWVELNPDLTEPQRNQLRRAYDKAVA